MGSGTEAWSTRWAKKKHESPRRGWVWAPFHGHSPSQGFLEGSDYLGEVIQNIEEQAHRLEIPLDEDGGGEWESVFLPPGRFEKYCSQQHGAISKFRAGAY